MLATLECVMIMSNNSTSYIKSYLWLFSDTLNTLQRAIKGISFM